MNLLQPLASLLGIELEELVERMKKDAAAWSAVAVFVAIGVVFLLMALHTWLVLLIGPIWAPLAIAGGALLIALLIFAAMRITDAVAERQQTERKHSAERTALVTTAAIAALPMVMDSDLMKKVGLPIGGALAAAFLLSRSSGNRRHNGHAED